ncbi:MAG: type III-A CRISPR-associated protein Csm2 [Erysipelotrichaceae bacterium]|nr:type III-A CRISPR-associated protein Csm2 [Erysipelotrichaceae bacterium]
MSYNDYNKRNPQPRGDRSGKRPHQDNRIQEVPSIQVPLSTYYADKAKLYLQNGEAYQTAKNLKDISTHQLRKILTQSKLALLETENHPDQLDAGRNLLFSLLPLAAYNCGRDQNLRPLYNFLCENISEKTLVTREDIVVFDDLFTSIVAYHKLFSKK